MDELAERNHTVRDPAQSGTPFERGCIVHYLPNRTERRRAARLMRRTYVGGKLSNNAQKNRVLRLNYEDRCARREALAKVS